jgi:hypothetical protein
MRVRNAYNRRRQRVLAGLSPIDTGDIMARVDDVVH